MVGPSHLNYWYHSSASGWVACEAFDQWRLLNLITNCIIMIKELTPHFPTCLTSIDLLIFQVPGNINYTFGLTIV